jgi:hypothetical protein
MFCGAVQRAVGCACGRGEEGRERNATERDGPGREVSKGKEKRKEERCSPTHIHKHPPIFKRIDEDDGLLSPQQHEAHLKEG